MGNFEYLSNDININEEYAEKLMENLNMKSSVINGIIKIENNKFKQRIIGKKKIQMNMNGIKILLMRYQMKKK